MCRSYLVVRADLHGTTLTHATSLRQTYDMTWDHLHAYDIFTYKTSNNQRLANVGEDLFYLFDE